VGLVKTVLVEIITSLPVPFLLGEFAGLLSLEEDEEEE
jgi:hypothetical protein